MTTAAPDEPVEARMTTDERLARGLYSHIHRGGCPDESEGWSSRDWECTACAMLDHFLTRLQESRRVCVECEGDTFACTACGARETFRRPTPTPPVVEPDYTACGRRLIAARTDQGGTAQVAVYCDLPAGHPPETNHHADVEWDEYGRAAQGSARAYLKGQRDE